ncbi:hypothetical protein [Ornithinibacillus scapharcae]|uniref:hypothetical protein n=1 Tax=Ornithinibacillus scapharcae TaxID=1147159 RepID=UPI000225B0F5|nr:hypothetical protein [Ornithinibacillus scapharcae]
MKKRSNINHHEKGLVLPSVLFLTTFVLLYFTNNLLAYNHDIRITQNLIEQVKAQTIFQMSYTQYVENYLQGVTPVTDYVYPDGKADIKLVDTGDIPLLHFAIQTNNDFHYFVTKHFDLPLDSHKSSVNENTILDD